MGFYVDLINTIVKYVATVCIIKDRLCDYKIFRPSVQELDKMYISGLNATAVS